MVSDREWWAWDGIPAVDDHRDDPGWDELPWDELATALPPEVAALLGNGRGGDDDDEADEEREDVERWPAPGDPCAVRSATYAACTPRFLAPAPLRARSQRVRRRTTRAR